MQKFIYWIPHEVNSASKNQVSCGELMYRVVASLSSVEINDIWKSSGSFSPLSGWLKNKQSGRVTETVPCLFYITKSNEQSHTFLKVPILWFILFLKNQTNKPSCFKMLLLLR